MIKKVSVTFDFDIETEAIENLECVVGEAIAKAAKPRKAPAAKKPKEDDEDEPKVRLESNKLLLNSKAADALGVVYGHRIILKYTVEGDRRIPMIGTDEAWDEEGNGNKVTKANTVPYRGNQNTILAEYGTEFDIELSEGGIFKLLPVGGIPETVGIVEIKPKKKSTPKKKKEDDKPKTQVVDLDMSEIKEMSRDAIDNADRAGEFDLGDSNSGEIDDFSFNL